MAIVVEDGTVVPGANSYLSVADARAFAAARGNGSLGSDEDVEVMLVRAMDYIDAREAKYVGARTSSLQEHAWPRTVGPSDLMVPQKIRDAQGFVVLAAAGGVDVLPVAESPAAFPVKREKVGPLETEFAVDKSSAAPVWPKVPGADDALAYYYGGIPRILYRYLGKT